jgi:hypothetical protein
MKKTMIVAALVAALAGCKSIEVERHGQQVATYTDTNGVVKAVCDNKGKPVLLDGGWSVDYFQHWNWQKFDELSATAGTGVSLTINKYESGADSNLVALVSTSLDGLTKLAVAVGEAYVKIAGGGAQADTALKTTSKIINYFRDKGGNVEKATVTTDETSGTLKIDDGTTCVSCDSSGNCTECTKTP